MKRLAIPASGRNWFLGRVIVLLALALIAWSFVHAAPAEACFLYPSGDRIEMLMGKRSFFIVQCSDQCVAEVTASISDTHFVTVSPVYATVGAAPQLFYLYPFNTGATILDINWSCAIGAGAWVRVLEVTRPAGGAWDDFGGGSTGTRLDDSNRINIPQSSEEVGVNRNIPCSVEYITHPEPGIGTEVRFYNADGSFDNYFIPLGESLLFNDGALRLSAGETPDLDTGNIGVQMRLFPAFWQNLPVDGQTRLQWRVGQEGAWSPSHWEYITLNGDNRAQDSQTPLGATDYAQTEELTFKLMVSYFADGNLTHAADAACQVYVDDVEDESVTMSGGFLTLPVRTTATTRLVLSSSLFSTISLRFQFQDGVLSVYEEAGESASEESTVPHFQDPDGNYALRYYRNQVFICNQGDPNGPIIGFLHEPASE